MLIGLSQPYSKMTLFLGEFTTKILTNVNGRGTLTLLQYSRVQIVIFHNHETDLEVTPNLEGANTILTSFFFLLFHVHMSYVCMYW
jgi:hypothetical protein